MSALVIIPARFGSTHFPAKILANQTGRPLVQHVVDQVRQCKRVRDVLVATDDKRITDALTPFGTRCVMTSPNHKSGTDRVHEAATEVANGAACGLADDIVVNVQGDEPEIEPAIIDNLIALMDRDDISIATAATTFPTSADPADPNLVKVVTAKDGRALYFSRSPIPFPRDGGTGALPIAFGESTPSAAPPSSSSSPILQRLWRETEKLEQLRALEIGLSIHVLTVERATHGIDTAEQYRAFVRRRMLSTKGLEGARKEN